MNTNLESLLRKNSSQSSQDEMYIGKIFQARDIIHLSHLNTQSYATHMALGSFYDGILDLADSITETLQGEKGVLFTITIPSSSAQEPISFLSTFKSEMQNWRKQTTYTWLQNEIDSILALTNQTIYKLKFLK